MSVSNLGDLLASSRQERASAENMYQDIFQSLKTALKDDEADVRAAAVEALGKIAALMKNNVAIESPKL